MRPAVAFHSRMIFQLALFASGAGAFLGAYLMFHPAGASVLGLAPAKIGATAGMRGLGGGLLLAHGVVLTALAQAPPIGACLAAGLGSGWFGATAGLAIGSIVDRRRTRLHLARMFAGLLLGVMLWAPLWAYLSFMRRQAGLMI